MYENDRLTLMVALKEHFSKATDGDAELMWQDLRGYDLADAKKAIEEHRREKGAQAWRPDLKRVRQLAAGFRNAKRRSNYANERIIDGVRREAGMKGDTRFVGVPDVAALTTHFAGAWDRVKEDADNEQGRTSIRALIFNHAKRGFAEVGMTDTEAEELARECVDIARGERIVTRSVLKSPEPAPTSWDAIKSLALVEGKAGAA